MYLFRTIILYIYLPIFLSICIVVMSLSGKSIRTSSWYLLLLMYSSYNKVI